jgi:hypothetical protein
MTPAVPEYLPPETLDTSVPQRTHLPRRDIRVDSWAGLLVDAAQAQSSDKEARLIDEIRALTLRESATPDEAAVPEELDWLDEQLNEVWTRIKACDRDGAEYVSLRRWLPLTYEGILDLLREGGLRTDGDPD